MSFKGTAINGDAMDLYAACDICGHRHVLSEDREGRRSKCQSCGTSFHVTEVNYYDPDSSEIDSEDPESESAANVATQLFANIGHGLTAIVTIALLVWMSSLFFRSPQQTVAALKVSPGNGGISNQKLVQPTAPFSPSMSVPHGQPQSFTQPGAWKPFESPQVKTSPQTGPRFPPNFQLPRRSATEMQNQVQKQMDEQRQRMNEHSQRINEQMKSLHRPNSPFAPPLPPPNPIPNR